MQWKLDNNSFCPVLCTLYVVVLSMANFLEVTFGYADQDIPMVTSHLTKIEYNCCLDLWRSSSLHHSPHQLFVFRPMLDSRYFHVFHSHSLNALRIPPLQWTSPCGRFHKGFRLTKRELKMKCNEECRTDEALCDYLLKLIKVTIIWNNWLKCILCRFTTDSQMLSNDSIRCSTWVFNEIRLFTFWDITAIRFRHDRYHNSNYNLFDLHGRA